MVGAESVCVRACVHACVRVCVCACGSRRQTQRVCIKPVYNQRYASKCLTADWGGQQTALNHTMAFVSFYGVNAPTMADFKLSPRFTEHGVEKRPLLSWCFHHADTRDITTSRAWVIVKMRWNNLETTSVEYLLFWAFI